MPMTCAAASLCGPSTRCHAIRTIRRGKAGRGIRPTRPAMPMSGRRFRVDAQRGLVFLPTSSPSPDYFGGNRVGDNRYANSVVALDGRTGEVAWHFQTVHHDLWDYDVPAQPGLYQVWKDGRAHDVVAQVTKTGLVFVLDRETGEPFLPVEERTVPQGGVEGEVLSPTQPFPVRTPPLVPQHARSLGCLRGDAVGPLGLCQCHLRPAPRRPLHAAERAGHAGLSLHRGRGELGQRCLRSGPQPAGGQHEQRRRLRAPDQASGRRRGDRCDRGWRRIRPDGGLALCHAPCTAALAARPAVLAAALGRARGGGPRKRRDRLAADSRHDRGPRAGWYCARHRGRPASAGRS